MTEVDTQGALKVNFKEAEGTAKQLLECDDLPDGSRASWIFLNLCRAYLAQAAELERLRDEREEKVFLALLSNPNIHVTYQCGEYCLCQHSGGVSMEINVKHLTSLAPKP